MANPIKKIKQIAKDARRLKKIADSQDRRMK